MSYTNITNIFIIVINYINYINDLLIILPILAFLIIFFIFFYKKYKNIKVIYNTIFFTILFWKHFLASFSLFMYFYIGYERELSKYRKARKYRKIELDLISAFIRSISLTKRQPIEECFTYKPKDINIPPFPEAKLISLQKTKKKYLNK